MVFSRGFHSEGAFLWHRSSAPRSCVVAHRVPPDYEKENAALMALAALWLIEVQYFSGIR